MTDPLAILDPMRGTPYYAAARARVRSVDPAQAGPVAASILEAWEDAALSRKVETR